jgi:hypothetical protein
MSDTYTENNSNTIPLLVEFTTTEGELQQVTYRHEDIQELTEKSNKAIGKALCAIQSIGSTSKFFNKNIDGRPDHVEVDFGIKFDAEAKASMEANLNVNLTWDNLLKTEPQEGSI